MKKRSQWILIMSVLLCLSILFVSCDTGSKADESGSDTSSGTELSTQETTVESTTEKETETETEPFVPEEEKVDYATIIKKWNQYISWGGDENSVPTYTVKEMFEDRDTPTQTVTVNSLGNNLVLVRTESVTRNFEHIVVSRSYRYDVYNVMTGKKIFTASVPSYNPMAEEDHLRIPSKTYQIHPLYDSNGYFTGIIEVTVGMLTNLTENPEEPAVYDYVYRYNYFNMDGETLASDLERRETATVMSDSLTSLITLGDKCYMSREGEIIYACDKGQERIIPEIDYEYNGYKYVFEDNGVMIFDSNYNLTAEKYVDLDGIVSTSDGYVLGNGDVVFQRIIECAAEATDFDFEMEGYFGTSKYIVDTVIINAATGKMTEVEFDYIVEGWISAAKSDYIGMDIKSKDYQFAEAYSFADGKLAFDAEYLILDNSLGKVDTLPKIVKNQSIIYGALDNSHVIIGTVSPAGELYYLVNTVKLNVKRYYTVQYDNDYIPVDGGYIYGGILYNNDGERLYDLRSTVSYRLDYDGETIYAIEKYGYEGDTLATDSTGNPIYAGEGIYRIRILHISDASLKTNTFVMGNNIYCRDGGFYQGTVEGKNTLLDKYGNVIISAEELEMSEIGDGVYMITVTQRTSEYRESIGGYVDVVYYEYYIMK